MPPLLWPAAGSAVLVRPGLLRGTSPPGAGAGGVLGGARGGVAAAVAAAVVAAVVVVVAAAAVVVAKAPGSVLLSRESSSPVGPQTMTSGSAVGRPSRGAKPRPRKCRRPLRERGRRGDRPAGSGVAGGSRRERGLCGGGAGAQVQGEPGRRSSSPLPAPHSAPRDSLCRSAGRGESLPPAPLAGGWQLARSMARWNMAIKIQAWLPSGQPDLRTDSDRVRKAESIPAAPQARPPKTHPPPAARESGAVILPPAIPTGPPKMASQGALHPSHLPPQNPSLRRGQMKDPHPKT